MAVNPAVIEGLFNLITTGFNYFNQEKTNKRQKQEQLEAERREYERNVQMWHMQNQYNHPQEQMNRLRQAGLNPNLVYGRGADNTAAAISSVQTQAPKLGIMEAKSPVSAQSIIAAQQQSNNNALAKASIDQTNSIIQLQNKEQLVKDAQIAKMAEETAYTKQQKETAIKLQDYTIKRAELENTNLEAMTRIANEKNDREELMNKAQLGLMSQDFKLKVQEIIQKKQDYAYSLLKYAQTQAEINKIEQEISNLVTMNENAKKDGIYKDWVNALSERGLSVSDPFALRMLESGLSAGSIDYGLTPEQTNMYINKANSYVPSTIKNYNKRNK